MSKPTARPIVLAVLLFFSLSYSLTAVAASSSPKVIQLVEVSSIEKTTLTISWLPTSDDNTAHEDLVYRVYLSKKADFLPDKASLTQEKAGAMSANLTGLTPATTYYVVVTATDEDGNVSWSNRLEGKTAAFNPKRTAVQVHELPANQFAKSAQRFKAGDYLVSRENGGMLRKIDTASRARQSTPAQHGALNELFSELAFSSTIKLPDLPEQL
ncbi:MAG: fibronectin type III domain-containing protein, partial [Methylovulum sp.]|nr:fibronectin type III domain-containing protein [Methylovulum sp.]